MKRIIAGILCATMLFSLDGFRNVSYAAGPDSFYSAEATTSDSIVEDASSSMSSEDSNTQENNEDAATSESGEAASSEASDEAATAETTEAASEATSEEAAEEQEAADEASSAASVEEEAADAASTASTAEEAEAADEASSAASIEELDADAASSASSADGFFVEKKLDENRVMGVNANNCFDVDENGTLILKKGYVLGNDVVIPAEATAIPRGIFNNNQNIEIVRFEAGSKLTTIAAGAFEDSSLETIEIPEGVTEIKDDTFKNAASLREVTFKGNIVSIGAEAFTNTDIMSLSIPKVTTIGNSAFLGCTTLKNIAVGELVSIGRLAFSGCSSLQDMTFGSTLKTIGNNAFAGCISLTSVDLRSMTMVLNGDQADNEGTIGANVFQNCTGIVTAYLPEKLVSVPMKAFSGCNKLKNVYIKDGTVRIANNAFEKCTALETISLPNVREIGSDAFDGCSIIKTVYIRYDGDEKISIIEDAFPLKSGVILFGYKEEVQDYAEKRGYTYTSLAEKYPVEVKIFGGSAGYKLSAKEASKGSKVNVTITPAKGYELQNVVIKETIPIEEDKIQLVETTATAQTFSFQMQGGKAIVEVNLVEKGKSTAGTLTPTLKGIKCSPSLTSNNEYKFDISGREAQLVIKDKNGETKSWLWNFTSNNAKVATVSSMGIVRTAGKGNAIITATLKSDAKTKVSVPIVVDDAAVISNIVLNIKPDEIPRTIKTKDDNLNKIDGENIPVVQYERSVIANNNMSFEVSIGAFTKDSSNDLVVKSVWTSTDPKIATVAANSTTNKNTVKIVKGAVGETLITVSVLNAGEKTASEANTKSFIVRVVDATPRLVNGNVTVDSNSTEGTLLDIRTVYGVEIAGNRLELCTKKKDSKGVITYPLCTALRVGHGNDNDTSKYYIVNSDPDTPFAKTYTGATQLYLTGTYKSDNGKGDTFYIPVPKITVTNTALNPTIKAAGKINLFYNSTADEKLSGVVKVSQSLNKLVVSDVKLVSAANHKKAGAETPDSFAANFNVENIDNKTFAITRTSNDMTKVGGKNVVSGFIYIWYEGYANPVKKAITVPTCDTAPEYVLNTASVTASGFSKDQKYELKLVDKKTKKTVVDMSTLDTGISESGNIIGLGLNSNSTQDLFKDVDMDAVEAVKKSNVITLSVDGQPRNGAAYIYVRMTTWSRALTYKFTITASRTLPTVKLSTTNATLNKTYSKQAATIKLTQNQPEAKLVAGKIRYVGKNKKLTDAADLLIKAMEYDGETIKINLPEKTRDAATDIATGTYNFSVTPDVTYDGKEDLDCKAVAFNVIVTQTNPTLKLNNATFVLNANTPGIEQYTRTYTIGNLPTGVTGTVDDSKVDYIPVGNIPELDKLGSIKFAEGNAVAQLENNNTVLLNAGKTLKYKVHGLTVKCVYKDEDGNEKVEESTIPDFVINLQLVKNAAAVKVAAAGTINPVDPTSKITYKAAVSYIVSDVDTVEVWEKDDKANYYTHTTGKKDYYSKHFEFKKDEANSKVGYLTVKDGEILENNKKYNITLVYTLKSVPGQRYTANFTVVPKQSLPQITTDKAAATIYAGQKNKTVKVKISKKAKPAINATLTKPEFVAGTSAAIKKAFKITDFNQETGEMTLELVNPSALVQNKDYTITFVTTYKNQATGSVGNKFNLKVTLRK